LGSHISSKTNGDQVSTLYRPLLVLVKLTIPDHAFHRRGVGANVRHGQSLCG
jgi:hypothetical protein